MLQIDLAKLIAEGTPLSSLEALILSELRANAGPLPSPALQRRIPNVSDQGLRRVINGMESRGLVRTHDIDASQYEVALAADVVFVGADASTSTPPSKRTPTKRSPTRSKRKKSVEVVALDVPTAIDGLRRAIATAEREAEMQRKIAVNKKKQLDKIMEFYGPLAAVLAGVDDSSIPAVPAASPQVMNPTQQQIVNSLTTRGEQTVVQLTGELGIHQTSVYRALRALRKAGVVQIRKADQKGDRTMYYALSVPIRGAAECAIPEPTSVIRAAKAVLVSRSALDQLQRHILLLLLESVLPDGPQYRDIAELALAAGIEWGTCQRVLGDLTREHILAKPLPKRLDEIHWGNIPTAPGTPALVS